MIKTIIVGMTVFNLIWALYTTFSKEKIMIEQGEGGLASSTYGFILLRYLSRLGLYILVVELIPYDWVVSISILKLFAVVVLSALIAEIISAVVETITRLVLFKIMMSKEK